MIIGIYSDAHFSVSSSIMTRTQGCRFSQRLDALVDSFNWMYHEFEREDCEIIINCGDLTNSDILRPEENAALYKALSSNIKKIPEYHILGNHEIKDKNRQFSSVSIIRGYDHITQFDYIYTITNTSDVILVFVPFMTDKDEYNKVYDILETLQSTNVPIYLFTHMSYIGENYNNYIETEGLDKIRLSSMYPNLKGIYNGHIHNAKDDGIYHQVGSLIGNSFGDNYSGGLPGIIILDTDTNTFKRIDNPFAPLFYKIDASTTKGLITPIKSMPSVNPKCLRIEVLSSLKDEFQEYVSQNAPRYNIIEFRIKSKHESVRQSSTKEMESLNHYKSPYDALKGFTESQDQLPYSQEEMISFLDTYIGGTK